MCFFFVVAMLMIGGGRAFVVPTTRNNWVGAARKIAMPPITTPSPIGGTPPTMSIYRSGSSLVKRTATSTTSSSEGEVDQKEDDLSSGQLDFVVGYLNKHHRDLLVQLAQVFSRLGADMAAANVWSGGSYEMKDAKLASIDFPRKEIELDVTIQRRNKPEEREVVAFNLDSMPIPEKARQIPSLPLVPSASYDDSINDVRLPIDDLVRRLCRLCFMVGQPGVSGKLIQLAIQVDGEWYAEI